MISTEKKIEGLMKNLTKIIFFEKDIKKLEPYYADMVTYTGINISDDDLKVNCYKKEDFLEICQNAMFKLNHEYFVTKEECHVEEVKNIAAMSICNIDLCKHNDSFQYNIIRVNISQLWRLNTNGDWEVTYVSITVNENEKPHNTHLKKMLSDARSAMEENQFMVYIQPQFDIQSRKLISGEALCRWWKDLSIVMPNDFIPIFEKTGFIKEFDFYMLECICAQMHKWILEKKDIRPISINQSQLHIEEENYLQKFCEIVDKYEIPHQYIAFELTESTFAEHGEKMLKLATHLHKENFQLAIDDFGTGYTSLSLLSIVAADILKIDKSLLIGIKENTRARVILEQVIEMAHRMQMTVICEGIETEEQLQFLQEIQCDIGQGFLVAKPIPAEEFENLWLKDHQKENVRV